MTYNLNLSREYCNHWSVHNAIRELIANNIDENGTLFLEENENVLYLINQSSLKPEAFIMGFSEKSADNPIGQYGEGLKIALAILINNGHKVTIESGDNEYKVYFKAPKGFSIETLHVDIVQSTINVVGTKIKVHLWPDFDLNTIYTDAPMNSVTKGEKGLFVRGLLIESDFYIEVDGDTYGVNLYSGLNFNRDRNYYPNKELIVPIIETSFTPTQIANISTSWWLFKIYENLSDEMAQKVLRVMLKENHNYSPPENKRVIVVYNDKLYHQSDEVIVVKKYLLHSNNLMRNVDLFYLEQNEIKESENKEDYLEAKYATIMTEIKEFDTIEEVLKVLVSHISLKRLDRIELLKYLVRRSK